MCRMGTMLTAKGRNGQITFDGKIITISREGAAARFQHGRGDKMLPIKHIAGVQLKPVSRMTVGYIQFTVPGELSNNKNKGHRTIDAGKDENAVLFLKKQEPDFVAMRDAIVQALADI